MRVLFLQSLTYPFVGLMSLSSVLKRGGHETGLNIVNFKHPAHRDLDRIADFQPKIVAFPVYTGWQRGVLHFCRLLKEKLGSITVGWTTSHPLS
ncbi:MAG: hypothetical protein ACLQPD_10885 [Desulfomonilaceae bacterium]